MLGKELKTHQMVSILARITLAETIDHLEQSSFINPTLNIKRYSNTFTSLFMSIFYTFFSYSVIRPLTAPLHSRPRGGWV